LAGKGTGVDYYAGAQGGSTFGISMADGSTYGVNNRIERNTVETTTTDQGYEAVAMYAMGAANAEATKTIIKDNVFMSNHLPIMTSADQGQAYYVPSRGIILSRPQTLSRSSKVCR